VTAKIAIGVAAVALASGAGYEGVTVVNGPATSPRPAKAAPAAVVRATPQPADVRTTPVFTKARPIAGKPDHVRGRSATAPGHTKTLPKARGRSATAPGHTKAQPIAKSNSEVAPGRTNALPKPKGKSAAAPGHTKTKPKPKPKPEATKKAKPVVPKPEPVRGKIAVPPGQVDPVVDVDTNAKKTR